MKQASTRDLLEELAADPIGSSDLQAHPFDKNGRVRPEVKEAGKRASKIWLPQGRKVARRGACNEPDAKQTDIEDAVESAGGKRGGLSSLALDT